MIRMVLSSASRWLCFVCGVFLVSLGGRPQLRADSIPQLIRALEDENVRYGAALTLAKMGPTAVSALIESLSADSPEVRIWSAFALGEMGPAAKPSVAELTKALAASDAPLRAAASQALGKISASKAVPQLATCLTDQDPRVRAEAAVALGRIGPTATAATESLVNALADPQVRRQARQALILIGGATTEKQLVTSLDDDKVRFDIALVLRKVAPGKARLAGVDRITRRDLAGLRIVLGDETRQTKHRARAASDLGSLGSAGVAALIEGFVAEHSRELAIGGFASADKAAVTALVKVLQDKQPPLRVAAARALEQLGPAARQAAPDLTRLLQDDDRNVRYHAVRALHELGPGAKEAVPALTKVILNAREQEPTRQWSIKALLVTLPETHDAVVKALIEATKEDQNYGVRQLARQKLKQIDAEAARAAGIQ